MNELLAGRRRRFHSLIMMVALYPAYARGQAVKEDHLDGSPLLAERLTLVR